MSKYYVINYRLTKNNLIKIIFTGLNYEKIVYDLKNHKNHITFQIIMKNSGMKK
jgi:hypothetical protein